MRRILFAAAVWVFGCAGALAQQTGPIYCGQMGYTPGGAAGSFTLVPNPNPGSATSIKAATGSSRIYICGYEITAAGGTSQLVYGTGTNCGTGTVTLSPAFPSGAVGADTSPAYRGLLVPNGSDVCLIAGAGATASSALVNYALQ